MKKVTKGFTLIELMIVVAIIGILAAIAIPNFLKYQLRAKYGELPTNLNAWFKAEESLRQSERTIPSGIGGTDADGKTTGQYFQTGLLPAACTTTPTKNAWTTNDIAVSSAIDWVVEGSTYGCYNSAVAGGTVTGYGPAMSIWAEADIDGDGSLVCAAINKPLLAQDGQTTTDAPAPACANAPDEKTPPFGQVKRAPDDNTF